MSDPGFLETKASDPRIGMVVQERYRIIRPLGEGGMGMVYEGEHVLIKRRVAIKCLHAQLASNPEIVARFHNEALAATSIGHQNIVEVTDMGQFDDGSVYMVLEFLDGRDLSKEIEEGGPLEIGRVVAILMQVCDALQAAHAKGIVHRDLKPENVFLIERGDNPDFVKVLDFGIAKFREGQSKSMTRTGTTMGTPYYMAPEQAQAKKDIDHRADIYSLGVILFHALTGQHPFDDESYPMLVVKICSEPPPPLRAYRPDVPEELEAVINRMLSKDPAERYDSCADVKAALAPFRSLGGAPVVSEDALPTARIPARAQSGVRVSGADTEALGEMGGGASPKAQESLEAGTLGDASLPRRSRMPLVVGLVAALLGLGGVAAAVALSSDGDEPAAGEVSDETADEAEVAPDESASDEAEAEPAPEASGESVRVQIETEPAGAELFLDGEHIANPFDADLPQTSEPRRLEARLEGYSTVVQDLSLRFPQRVRIELERGGGVDDRRRERPRRREARREETSTTERARTTATQTSMETGASETTSTTSTTAMEETASIMESPSSMEEEESGRGIKRVRF